MPSLRCAQFFPDVLCAILPGIWPIHYKKIIAVLRSLVAVPIARRLSCFVQYGFDIAVLVLAQNNMAPASKWTNALAVA